MSRKRKKSVPATLRAKADPYHVGTIDAMTVTRARMPRYDGFVCRGGVHGTTSYDRRATKAATRRLISEEM